MEIQKNGQNGLRNSDDYDTLRKLAITICHDLYTTIQEVNHLKVMEYTKVINEGGDPTGYFYKQLMMHKARMDYAKWLRKNGAFYSRIIGTLRNWINKHG